MGSKTVRKTLKKSSSKTSRSKKISRRNTSKQSVYVSKKRTSKKVKYNTSFLNRIPDNVSDTDYMHKSNIVKAARKIFNKLALYDEVICCAQMQSGKTDVMKRLIYIIKNYRNDLDKMGINVSRNNIYLVICASSVNLKNQLEKKLPEIRGKIFHLNNLIPLIKNKFEHENLLNCMSDSSLIIYDECHCDAKQKSLIDNFRNLLDTTAQRNYTNYLRVGFSATPYEQIKAGYPRVIMHPDSGYYGIVQMFESMIKQGSGDSIVIRQSKDIREKDECIDLFTEITIENYYYIFRLPKYYCYDIIINNIEKEFTKRGFKVDSYIYDMAYSDDINYMISSKPRKPTIIYIKDKLRMGEYLNTEYVYMVHDDSNNSHSHTTVQSLLGRCCGYNKKNNQTIIYCDIVKAWQHYKWIINKYSVKTIPTDAKYINNETGKTSNACIY